MSHPVSVRFHNDALPERLKAEASARGTSVSALAEELIEEGLRSRRHPLVVFRDGATGRRAAIVGGPDIWEVIAGLVGGDVPSADRVARAMDTFGLAVEQVNAALDYYAEFVDEIAAQIEQNVAAAEEAGLLWRRRQQLLAG